MAEAAPCFAEPDRVRPTAALIVVTLVALSMRLHSIGAQSLWLDEAYSVRLARLAWSSFARLVWDHEASGLPYYLLLRGWVHLGLDEASVRALSVVFSVATIPIVHRLGTRLFNARVGLTAAALLAVNAYHVKFAQEARSYSLLLFLLALSTLLFARALERPRKQEWAAYVVVSVLAVYSHFFGALTVVAQWASLLFLRRTAVSWRPLLLSIGAIGLCLAPIALVFLPGRATQETWIAPPTFHSVLVFLQSLLGARQGPTALAAILSVVSALALLATARRWRAAGRGPHFWPYGLALAWFVLPLCLVLGVSVVTPLFVDKYLLQCLIPLTLLLAVGICQLRSRWLFGSVLTSVVSMSVLGVVLHFRKDRKEGWREAAGYVLAEARPTDAVLFFPDYAGVAFDYYRERWKLLSDPRQMADPSSPVWFVGENQSPSELLGAAPTPYERAWVIVRYDDSASRPTRDSLVRRYRVLDERSFTAIRVTLLCLSTAAPPVRAAMRAGGESLAECSGGCCTKTTVPNIASAHSPSN